MKSACVCVQQLAVSVSAAAAAAARHSSQTWLEMTCVFWPEEGKGSRQPDERWQLPFSRRAKAGNGLPWGCYATAGGTVSASLASSVLLASWRSRTRVPSPESPNTFCVKTYMLVNLQSRWKWTQCSVVDLHLATDQNLITHAGIFKYGTNNQSNVFKEEFCFSRSFPPHLGLLLYLKKESCIFQRRDGTFHKIPVFFFNEKYSSIECGRQDWLAWQGCTKQLHRMLEIN